ncbi:MAG: hypothetical protein H6728_07160 [Myxococcales bacterium]|nr:hypothetical protein [Myxococcales bacterium]
MQRGMSSFMWFRRCLGGALVAAMFLLLGGALSGCQKQQSCTADEECPVGQFCKSGTCGSSCKDDNECDKNKNEICNLTRGKCQEKTQQTCTPQASRQCAGGHVFWFDSCGYQQEKAQDCGSTGCDNGQCKEGDTCGNGSCEPGKEDCQSCPQDCGCKNDEKCNNGVCEKLDTCGNGACETDKGEDCAKCPGDCACPSGMLCDSGQCQKQESCGNGKCEGDQKENCLSCPGDCPCGAGEVCDPSLSQCRQSCGDNKCDTKAGENCSNCPGDCACATGQRCSQGRCERTCGNGRCETSYGEDCSSCPQDCLCQVDQACKEGKCGADCGNGTCDADKGENCSTCAADCACASDKYCESGQCTDWCGNRVCDASKGENCDTCASDCACSSGSVCKSGQCVALCGDGTCDAAIGEDCGTCPQDCACQNNESCISGKCTCVPDCKDKECGSDGCGGTCGSCVGTKNVCDNGKCTCNNTCQPDQKQCVGANNYESCQQDADGCYQWKRFECPPGRVCQDGSCCEASCGNRKCGPDGCGGECGQCSSRSTCNNGNCDCTHECPTKGAGVCDGTGAYKECLEDFSGCRYWSAVRNCVQGQVCANGACCTPNCTAKECGTDGCTGTCGSCGGGCIGNLCARTIKVTVVDINSDNCNDDTLFISGKPDPFILLTLGNGKEYKSARKDDTKGTVTFNWTVTNLDPLELKNAKLEAWDYDSGVRGDDDLCGRWSSDLSNPGTKTLTDSGHRNVKITVTVTK